MQQKWLQPKYNYKPRNNKLSSKIFQQFPNSMIYFEIQKLNNNLRKCTQNHLVFQFCAITKLFLTNYRNIFFERHKFLVYVNINAANNCLLFIYKSAEMFSRLNISCNIVTKLRIGWCSPFEGVPGALWDYSGHT